MLELSNVSFAYNSDPILKSISFTLDQGKHLSVIGASGCGKTTLLEAIYGLLSFQGEISWGDKKITKPEDRLVPGEPFIKYLSQSFDLYPFHKVSENVGKHLKSIPLDEKQDRIQELLEMVEMEDYADMQAKYLSGGQQQRVAIVQALAQEPELLLLDEPFSHIDQYRRNNLRRNIFNYLKEKNITCIVATHDPTEVLSFSDDAIVMKEGEIMAHESPSHLYFNPKSRYVATLFGEVSEVEADVLWPSLNSNRKVLLYPHDLYVEEGATLSVKVVKSYFSGKDYLVEASNKGEKLFFNHPELLERDIEVGLSADYNKLKGRLEQ
ncbi:ABC transporter ATP-binding protein [Fulvivirga sediminis]|uniref:ABC transporter ATP-binding protein n=1 Tax=Fulvivirga sediminis TaxID=2803949 RepID=A0A937F4W7_9BACT|nr:ABC transporter ATP-binding protein [Fulvivirga sediminis]MBL3654749.1 ABC transporter ATP-binding protein [Fulvivirga sediminis]